MINERDKYNYCWLCGTKENITLHHVLPQEKVPKNRFKIPLCNKHHIDVEGLKYMCELLKGETYISPSKIRKTIKGFKELWELD